MNGFLLILFQSIYILIPAYFANMAPPIFNKLRIFEYLNKPIDGGKKLSNGEYIFGKNKTYRGFISGIILGIIGAFLQMFLYNYGFFKSISVPGMDYSNPAFVLILGALLSIGALGGDLIESFFKRRLNIKSGERFVPWDQIDHIIGAYLCILIVAASSVSWKLFAMSIVTGFVLHVMINHLSFYLGIRKEKWSYDDQEKIEIYKKDLEEKSC